MYAPERSFDTACGLRQFFHKLYHLCGQCWTHSHWWSPFNSLLEVIQVGTKHTCKCMIAEMLCIQMSVLYYCTVLQHRPIFGFILDMAHTGQVPVMALTATAMPAVQEHIMEFLGRPVCVIGSMNQHNITYSVYNLTSSKGAKGYTVCRDISRLFEWCTYDACSGWATIVIPDRRKWALLQYCRSNPTQYRPFLAQPL